MPHSSQSDATAKPKLAPNKSSALEKKSLIIKDTLPIPFARVTGTPIKPGHHYHYPSQHVARGNCRLYQPKALLHELPN